jgi:hypothetical protein
MSTLITEEYKAQSRQLHEEGSFGVKGHSYAQRVLDICNAIYSSDVLDYGCGRHTLAKSLAFPIKEYDPCLEGFDSPPAPADVVVCTDVLEHIEPECLDAVLDDLKRVTRKFGFFAVDIRPARKTLPDGRNAHLIQEPAAWWFPKLYQRWSTVQISEMTFDSQTTPGVVKVLGFFAVVKDPR